LRQFWRQFVLTTSAVADKTQERQGCHLPGPKKLKSPNLAISSFKKGQILKNEKRQNKGQIFFKKLLKLQVSKLEFHQILQVLLRFLQNRL